MQERKADSEVNHKSGCCLGWILQKDTKDTKTFGGCRWNGPGTEALFLCELCELCDLCDLLLKILTGGNRDRRGGRRLPKAHIQFLDLMLQLTYFFSLPLSVLSVL